MNFDTCDIKSWLEQEINFHFMINQNGAAYHGMSGRIVMGVLPYFPVIGVQIKQLYFC